MSANQDKDKEIVIGRRAVLETLRSSRQINAIHIAHRSKGGSMGKIVAQSKERGIVLKEVTLQSLDYLSGDENHQGVIALVAPYKYSTIDDVFSRAEKNDEKPFIVLCDEIEDPHNLGAIIRSAEAAGAHGVIIPKRRSALVTHAVASASAGAIEHIPIVRVTNFVQTIAELKEKGLWFYGAETDGEPYEKTNFAGGAVGLIIGSEGKGIGRLIREKCDFIVSIPMHGKINSLNASVAGSILMFEIARQRDNTNEG